MRALVIGFVVLAGGTPQWIHPQQPTAPPQTTPEPQVLPAPNWWHLLGPSHTPPAKATTEDVKNMPKSP